MRREGVNRCAAVISGRMFGGGQRVVLDLVTAGTMHEKAPKVVLLGHRINQFDSIAPLIVNFDGRYDRVRSILAAAQRLRHVLSCLGVRMIHTHGWDADIIGCLATTGLATKQLVHLHVTPQWLRSGAPRHKVRRALTKQVLRRANTAVVAVAEAVGKYWIENLGLASDSVQIIKNGVDTSRYRPLGEKDPRSVPVIGVAARLAPMKGLEYLLDALGTLARNGTAFRLKVAGEGELRGALEERCRRLGIGRQTEFLGYVEDMPAFYNSIDLYALPSVSTEGLPLGILEAMASGLPVVASRVAGIPEAVRNDVDGLIVPPRDVEAFSDALKSLLVDPDTRQAMGRAGRGRSVTQFSLSQSSSQVFQLYKKLLEE